MPYKAENIIPFIKSAAAYNEPLIIVNENFKVEYLNKPAEKLFGIKKLEQGKIGLSVLLDLKNGDRENILHEAKRTRGKRRTLRLNALGKNDSLIPVEVSSISIKDLGRSYYLLKAIDLTEKLETIDKLRQEKKNIDLLKSVAIAANEATSFEVAIRFVLNKICQRTGWHIGHAFRISDIDKSTLESMRVWAHSKDFDLGDFKKKTDLINISSGEGLAGHVFKTQKAKWVLDATDKSSFLRHKEAKKAGIKSAIAFPLLVKDKVTAVVEFFSRNQMDPPDKKFLELMENIGIILGRVVERDAAAKKLSTAYHKLKEAQKNLVHSEKLAVIGRFSSGLAHEIRNPLANINAAVQYMVGKYSMDERLKDSLSIIERNGRSANNIINEMLKYASPAEIKLIKGSVSDVINDVHKMVKARCDESKIKCVKKISLDLPQIMINKIKLEEALSNFVSNAIDSMSKGGGILTFSAAEENDNIVIKIKDTGVGISEKDIDKIFDPYYTNKSHGTGLGMGLAQNIINAHKGTISVKSKTGEGTEITVSLPIN
jgi:PAS domain S-box-containing protein